jgi:hypothetical protein
MFPAGQSRKTIEALAKVFGLDPDELTTAPPSLLLSKVVPAKPRLRGEEDFNISFDPDFEPVEVKDILTAFADYYRVCGGAGFEIDLESQEATVKEPVHA